METIKKGFSKITKADPDLNNKFISKINAARGRINLMQRSAKSVAAILDFLNGKNPQNKKYTKRWLAEQLNVTEQAVGQFLKVGNNMQVETLHKISEVIGVDLFAVMANPVPVETPQGEGAGKPESAWR